jgi:hypothetical protein
MSLFPVISPAAAVFLPTDLANLELWVRSDLGITKDGSDFVSNWADQSGNGRDFAEATNKPLWVDSLVNGEAAVRFDGSNDLLTASSWSQALPVHVFLVVNQKTWVSEDGVWGGTATSGQRLFQFSATPGLKTNAGTASTAAVSLATGTFGLVYSYHNSSSENWIALNDGAESANTADIGTTAPGGFRLGVGYGGSAGFSNIEIAEFMVTSAEVTGADLTNLKTYINSRYSLW